VIFGGSLPVLIGGTSAGTVEQDIAVAVAAAAAVNEARTIEERKST
jgi:hypothetical protein